MEEKVKREGNLLQSLKKHITEEVTHESSQPAERN